MFTLYEPWGSKQNKTAPISTEEIKIDSNDDDTKDTFDNEVAMEILESSAELEENGKNEEVLSIDDITDEHNVKVSQMDPVVKANIEMALLNGNQQYI
jgi:hypothetical protein